MNPAPVGPILGQVVRRQDTFRPPSLRVEAPKPVPCSYVENTLSLKMHRVQLLFDEFPNSPMHGSRMIGTCSKPFAKIKLVIPFNRVDSLLKRRSFHVSPP